MKSDRVQPWSCTRPSRICAAVRPPLPMDSRHGTGLISKRKFETSNPLPLLLEPAFVAFVCFCKVFCSCFYRGSPPTNRPVQISSLQSQLHLVLQPFALILQPFFLPPPNPELPSPKAELSSPTHPPSPLPRPPHNHLDPRARCRATGNSPRRRPIAHQPGLCVVRSRIIRRAAFEAQSHRVDWPHPAWYLRAVHDPAQRGSPSGTDSPSSNRLNTRPNAVGRHPR